MHFTFCVLLQSAFGKNLFLFAKYSRLARIVFSRTNDETQTFTLVWYFELQRSNAIGWHCQTGHCPIVFVKLQFEVEMPTCSFAGGPKTTCWIFRTGWRNPRQLKRVAKSERRNRWCKAEQQMSMCTPFMCLARWLFLQSLSALKALTFLFS